MTDDQSLGQILALSERVRNILALRESHFREFKSALEGRPGKKRARSLKAVRQDIAEALVAFTNTDGGDLLIGVEDDGEITGLPYSQRGIEALSRAYSDLVLHHEELPIAVSTPLTIDGKAILFFSVAKSSTRIFQLTDGRCLVRRGTATPPAEFEALLFDRQEAASRAFDSAFDDRAMLVDLDTSLVNEKARSFVPGITAEKYLQQLGLGAYSAGGLRLTKAALLLFGSDVLRWHPRCQVRILRIRGNELKLHPDYNVTADDTVTDNVLNLIPRTWEKLRLFLVEKTSLRPDARFTQTFLYPELACLEALINALAHRDYEIHRSVEVRIFDDRMEIVSPGALLSTLRLQDLLELKGAHESRNPLIARLLREAGLMRELGEGMRRIFQAMEDSERKRPEIESEVNSFKVTLFQASSYSEQQLAWISLFERYQMSQLQRRIVVAGMEGKELSPRDIYAAMRTNDRDTYDREVTALREANILVQIRTNPQALRMANRLGMEKASIPRFRVQPPVEDSKERKVVLFNPPKDVSESEIREVLGAFGQIQSVQIRKDLAGNTYAFIGFAHSSSAGAASGAHPQLFIRNHPITIKPRT